MNISQTMNNIVARHAARVEACGDKLMNAEKDMSVLLDIMENYFAPIILAAKSVHDVRDKPGAHPMDLVDPLTDMSQALRNAGLVK